MMTFWKRSGGLLALSSMLLPVWGAFAQEAETPAADASQARAKRPIAPEDYGQWESLGFATGLSPDGTWLAYQVNRVDDKDQLRLRMLATDATDVYEYGGSPLFSKDSNWFAFSIGVSSEERDRRQAANQPVRNTLGLRSLTSGDLTKIDNVQSFTFSDNSRYLVMRRYGGGGEGAAAIVLRDLQTGIDTNFGNVGSYAFSDDSTLLAMVIDAADKAGNGVQVFDCATGVLRTLDSASATYTGMTWREDARDLAIMREIDHEDDEDTSYVILAWRGLDGAKPRRFTFDHTQREEGPDRRVVDFDGVRWSDDGAALFFGIKDWEKKPKSLTPEAEETETSETEGDADAGDRREQRAASEQESRTLRDTLDDPSNVEVWHARDIDIIPLQQRRESQNRRENDLCVWWLDDDAFNQLENDLTEDASLLEGHRTAIGSDNTPYEEEKRFGPTVSDRYLIDVRTGEATKFLDRNKYILGGSPDARSVLYVRNDNIWSYETNTAEHHNLTGAIGVPFINQEASQLTDEKPPYGIGGWLEDSSAVLLYDRYDMWLVAADGSVSQRLTNGAGDRIRYRRTVVDREAEEFIDPAKPFFVSIYGDTTKMNGYGRLTIGEGDARVPESFERLVWEDLDIGRLTKADDADVYAIVKQDYDDSPDIFIGGAGLANARQISATNPFQKDYLWGHTELISYENVHGEPLQGALTYPADYEPGKQYPMIVYIYELRSQTLHSYSVPSETSAYNPAVFSAEGYFVYQPDIVYRAQNPGVSAVECVVPAVEKILETGMIDRDRIGLVGHSWGAYQTAFIVTQTDLFAAGIAGAPLTNMMSMSMSIYWNSGQTDAWIFHESQGRMDRPFWQDVDTYIKNSPIFNIDNMNTPLMIAFGTEDGAVDYNQGVEMYNAARLAGKQFVMLVYPGENHGLAREENQVDYHYRILEWFAHYLKGDEAPKWITEGKSHLERQQEIEANQGGSGAGAGGRGGGRGRGRGRGG